MRTQSAVAPPLFFLDLFLVLALRDLAIIYYGTKRIIYGGIGSEKGPEPYAPGGQLIPHPHANPEAVVPPPLLLFLDLSLLDLRLFPPPFKVHGLLAPVAQPRGAVGL